MVWRGVAPRPLWGRQAVHDNDDADRGQEGEEPGPLRRHGAAQSHSRRHQPTAARSAARIGEGETDRERRPERDQDVENTEPRLDDQQRVGGGQRRGEQGPAPAEEEQAAQGVDECDQGDTGERRHEAPAEWAVAGEEHARRDRQLAELWVRGRPFAARPPRLLARRSDVALQDRSCVVDVVVLVEHQRREARENRPAGRRPTVPG